MRELEHVSNEQRLRKLGLCSLEKRGQSDSYQCIHQCKYFKGGVKRTGTDSSAVPRDRIRDDGHKLKHRKLHLNMKKNFFTVGVTDHWNRLPRGRSLPPWRYSKPTWTHPVQPPLGESALSRGAWT